MEKHKQDSEVKMTIRFEEEVSIENAQFVLTPKSWTNNLFKGFSSVLHRTKSF